MFKLSPERVEFISKWNFVKNILRGLGWRGPLPLDLRVAARKMHEDGKTEKELAIFVAYEIKNRLDYVREMAQIELSN